MLFGAGLAELLGTSFGRTSVVVSVIVLLVGMAAGVRPGIGTLPGGPVGIGTVLFALGIGPAVQLAFRVLRQSPARPSVAVAA